MVSHNQSAVENRSIGFQDKIPPTKSLRIYFFNFFSASFVCSYVVPVCSSLRSRQDLGLQFQQVRAQRHSKRFFRGDFFWGDFCLGDFIRILFVSQVAREAQSLLWDITCHEYFSILHVVLSIYYIIVCIIHASSEINCIV